MNYLGKNKKLQGVRSYFSGRKDIVCVYLFGSYALGRENRYSDIDLAVLLDDGVEGSRYTDLQIKLAEDLSQLLKREVDVVLLNRAGAFLKFRVIQKGTKIFDKRKARREFEAASILEYGDFYPVKNFLESRMLNKIREA